MLSEAERERREAEAAELVERRRVEAQRQAAVREIATDPVRAVAYLEGYLAGAPVPVDPTVIAARVALGAAHVDEGLGVVRDELTAQLCDGWSERRTGPWGPVVLTAWPGLVRHARHRSASAGAEALRADMREAVPALATADGWRKARRWVVPFAGHPTPWVTLATIAAQLAGAPEDDTPGY